jgi:chromosome partitioning protein
MAHPIVTVATLKGGSGKSTIASCLGVYWHLRGQRTTLLDTDPQRSIVRLAAREKALGGIPVVEDSSDSAWKTAQQLAQTGRVIVDTPGFRSEASTAALAVASFVLVPVRASPLDVDRMLDALSVLVGGVRGWTPTFRCLLTQTTRGTVIAKHIRDEIVRAGFPMIESELPLRVSYPEAALYGATPTMIDPAGPAARDIAAIADEIDSILSIKQVRSA